MVHIAVFASGAGSNAQQVIHYFRHHPAIQVSLVVCNRSEAGVTGIAAAENIPVLIIEKEKFFQGDAYTGELQSYHINFIVLAGFLWKLPARLIATYTGRIINIHPALLPKYGGKGMYGNFVHTAVIAAGEKESGITIHYVDEWYDHGSIIFQATCNVEKTDDARSLANKIQVLEHTHYPRVIEQTLQLQKHR